MAVKYRTRTTNTSACSSGLCAGSSPWAAGSSPFIFFGGVTIVFLSHDRTRACPGAYVSASASMTRYEGHAAGFGTLKVAATMNDSWAVGLAFSGLYYDKKLTALVSDGTYHANAAYAALYLEKFFPLTERLTASASITSGTGEMKYEYDQEYRAQKVWYQETIDQTTFAVFEPGAALMWRVSDAWQLGVQASYRSTSPLRLIGTSEALLREFNYGLTVKWQFL